MYYIAREFKGKYSVTQRGISLNGPNPTKEKKKRKIADSSRGSVNFFSRRDLGSDEIHVKDYKIFVVNANSVRKSARMIILLYAYACF